MESKQRTRIPRKSLQEVKEVVVDELSGMSWEQAEKLCRDGKLIRRKTWPAGEFLFYRPSKNKVVTDNSPEGVFFEPITKEFLQARGVRHFFVSGHFNKWNKNNNLMVGVYIFPSERRECDWELHETKYDIFVKTDKSFEEILQMGMEYSPKKKK